MNLGSPPPPPPPLLLLVLLLPGYRFAGLVVAADDLPVDGEAEDDDDDVPVLDAVVDEAATMVGTTALLYKRSTSACTFFSLSFGSPP